MDEIWVYLIINGGILLVNLIIFALNLKLYTEILKDASQWRRRKAQDERKD